MIKQTRFGMLTKDIYLRIIRRIERITDMRICGELLGEYVPSIDRDEKTT